MDRSRSRYSIEEAHSDSAGGAETWLQSPFPVVDLSEDTPEHESGGAWKAARAFTRDALFGVSLIRNSTHSTVPTLHEAVSRSEMIAVVAELRQELADSRHEMNQLRVALEALRTHRTSVLPDATQAGSTTHEPATNLEPAPSASLGRPVSVSIDSRRETGAAGPIDANSSPSAESRIRALVHLQYGWDDEGAAPPSELAVHAALLIANRMPVDLQITEIEADVIGGIVIWIDLATQPAAQATTRWVSFAIRNTGKVLVTLDEHVSGGSLSVEAVHALDRAFDCIRAFLQR